MQFQQLFSARQRGYSLVELAIALAVIGLIMGGIVVPIGNQIRTKTYQRANLQLGLALDAIIGYAATHRSPGWLLANNFQQNRPGFSLYGFRTVRIPNGRPYLPCPDTDGDGNENRNALVRPSDVGSTVFAQGSVETRFLDSTSLNHNSRNTLLDGSCTSYYGLLPWRALGLAESDPWGGRLTYIVHPHFAVAAYGFDQETRAITALNIVRNNERLAGNGSSLQNVFRGIPTGRPILACDLIFASAIASSTEGAGCSQDLRTAAGGKANELASSNLHSLPANTDIDDFHTAIKPDYPRPYLRGRPNTYVTDGLPFAIISHGQNRLGSSTTFTNTTDNTTTNICATLPPVNTAEAINASYNNICTTNVRQQLHNKSNAPFIAANTSTDPVYQYLFAARRASTSARDPVVSGEYFDPLVTDSEYVFDDVVTWLTRRELAQRLTREKIFPLEVFNGLETGYAIYSL